MAIVTGQKSVGFSNPRSVAPTLPASDNVLEIIADLQAKYASVETLLQSKVSADGIKSAIRASPELIAIEASDIVLLGTVTIAQIVNDQNGTTPGAAPALLTRVRGDKIQTGSIRSNNWGPTAGTAWDLDNETIHIGGSDDPKLLYDGTDLFIQGTLTAGAVIAGSVTVTGVSPEITIGSINSNAELGASHSTQTGNVHGASLAQISGDLDDIADGSSYFRQTSTQAAGATRAANALDSSFDYIRAISTTKLAVSLGALGGSGAVFDAAGIRGYSGGVLKFNIDTSGNISIAGDISGSNGTFSGNLQSTGYMFGQGAYVGAYGIAAAVQGQPTANNRGVIGYCSGTAGGSVGVTGWTQTGYGVQGYADDAAGVGVYASNGSSSGVALAVVTGLITKSRVNGHLIKVYDTSTHALVGTYEYSFE